MKYIKIKNNEGNYILRRNSISLLIIYRIKNKKIQEVLMLVFHSLKKIDKAFYYSKLVDLICFEVILPEIKWLEQFIFLKEKGFKVVYNEICYSYI